MKYKVFEYVCYRIHQFYLQNKPEDIKKYFNIIRLTNLLFMISGIDKGNHLFDIFRFQGWFYGHMDPDIYKEYSKNDLIFKEEPIIEDPEIKKKVDICIDKMIKEHPNTITAGFWNLLFILQNLISYKHMEKYNICYEDMDKNLMIYEPKVYL